MAFRTDYEVAPFLVECLSSLPLPFLLLVSMRVTAHGADLTDPRFWFDNPTRCELSQQTSSGLVVKTGRPTVSLFHYYSGQTIATSHDLTPNGGLVREILYFREIQVGEPLQLGQIIKYCSLFWWAKIPFTINFNPFNFILLFDWRNTAHTKHSTASFTERQEKCRNMPAFVNQIPTNILIDLDRQYLVNFIAVPRNLCWWNLWLKKKSLQCLAEIDQNSTCHIVTCWICFKKKQICPASKDMFFESTRKNYHTRLKFDDLRPTIRVQNLLPNLGPSICSFRVCFC